MVTPSLDAAINQLQKSYLEYMARLKDVLDYGDANVGPLVAALDHKHANPIAKALGLMMHSPAAEQAIPALLSWLVTQSPLYPDVLEALVRAGERPVQQTLHQIHDYAAKNDDEAVRHLLDLACRFPTKVLPEVVATLLALLESPDPDIRISAADAVWRIGLPQGLPAKAKLMELSRVDPNESVRQAAAEALDKLG